MSEPYFRHVSQAETLSVAGDVYAMLALGADTEGLLMAMHAIIPPGGGPPPHVHTREAEAFYVLEGRITFTVAGVESVAGPGTFVYSPRDVAHRFENRDRTPAHMLIFALPSGLELMFRAVGDPLAPGATVPTPVTETTVARLIEECPKYGVQILPADHGSP